MLRLKGSQVGLPLRWCYIRWRFWGIIFPPNFVPFWGLTAVLVQVWGLVVAFVSVSGMKRLRQVSVFLLNLTSVRDSNFLHAIDFFKIPLLEGPNLVKKLWY